MKSFAARAIRFYQTHISPYLRPACVFYPTCSEYTREAILKYGVLRGSWKGLRRILRCHPWQQNHLDPLL